MIFCFFLKSKRQFIRRPRMKLDSPDLTKGPPGKLGHSIKWFSQGDVVAARCCGQEWMEKTDLRTKVFSSAGPCLSLCTYLLIYGTRCPWCLVHPSFIKCLESVPGRIWRVRLSQCGCEGATSLEWEKVQRHKEKWGLPPTGN